MGKLVYGQVLCNVLFIVIHILRAATTVPFGCMVGGGFGLMSCCFCE